MSSHPALLSTIGLLLAAIWGMSAKTVVKRISDLNTCPLWRETLKFLFIPGFAKSGTTYLYDQLAALHGQINAPTRKEIGAFKLDMSLERFLNYYPNRDDGKIYLDATPDYLLPNSPAIDDIKRVLDGHDIKILICVRSPISRAYSQYLHNIRLAWRVGVAPFPFYDPRIISSFIFAQAPLVAHTQNLFGVENVFGFTAGERDSELPQGIRDHIGLGAAWALDPRGEQYSGGWMPEVYFDAREPLLIENSGELFELPRGTLMISMGEESFLKFNFPVTLGERLVRNASTWTRICEPCNFGAAADVIFEDYLETCQLLGITLRKNDDRSPLFARRPPPLPTKVSALLRRVGSVGDTVGDLLRGERPIRPIICGPDVIKIRKEIDALYAGITNRGISNATPAEVNVFNYALVEALDAAIAILGPDPEYVQEFILTCFVTGQGPRAVNALKEHPEYRGILDVALIAEKAAYFRPVIGDAAFREIVDLAVAGQISPFVSKGSY